MTQVNPSNTLKTRKSYSFSFLLFTNLTKISKEFQ
jgi:hypothetical protein